MRLLLAEDERSLSKALCTILTRNGYEVDAALDGQDALERIESGCYDAVVLDIMMPKVDGITVLKTIRANGNLTPVLMLTAKSEIDDKVTGLEAGANDYLTKPFNSRELMARIHAMTRALDFQNHPRLTYGNVTIDRESLELSTSDGSLRLAHREFQMLELLMSNPKGLVSRERFFERIWKDDADAQIGIVEIYLSYLKNKLRSLHADVEIAETADGEYMLKSVVISDEA